MQVAHYGRNPTGGRDLLVGDVHGTFSKLRQALDDIGFNPMFDRVFSVGDLVDRGPESVDVLDWIGQPWFKAVRGNHDQMCIDTHRGISDGMLHAMNGGAWFFALPPERREQLVQAFEALPIAIDLETEHGLVGLLHADCPAPRWDVLLQRLAGPDAAVVADLCMWSRDRVDSRNDSRVEDIRAVVVGHTPMQQVTSLGNVYYIDCGAWLPMSRGPRPFVIVDASTLEEARHPVTVLAWEE